MKKKLRKYGSGAWPKQRDLPNIFGNPSKAGWGPKYTTWVKPPWKMFAGKLPIKSIQINKLVAKDFEAILNEIWVAAGKDQRKIRAWGMDQFDGSFVVRRIRGGNSWSNHAFAMAIDLDALHNPLGSGTGRFTASHPAVKIFEAHGVRWGGRYKGRPDPMHFEWVSG